MRTLIGLAVAAVLMMAGCGESDEGRVESSLEDFQAALEARDGTKACDSLSPGARADLLTPLLLSGATENVDPAVLGGESVCVSVIDSLDVRAVAVVGDLAEADIEKVDLRADRASVTTSSGTYEFGEGDGEIELTGIGPLAEALEEVEAPDPALGQSRRDRRRGKPPAGSLLP